MRSKSLFLSIILSSVLMFFGYSVENAFARANISAFNFTFGSFTRNLADYASTNYSPPPVIRVPSGASVSFAGAYTLAGSSASDFADIGCQADNVVNVSVGGTPYCGQGINVPLKNPLSNFSAVFTNPSSTQTNRVILVLRVFDSQGLAQEASLPLDVLPSGATTQTTPTAGSFTFTVNGTSNTTVAADTTAVLNVTTQGTIASVALECINPGNAVLEYSGQRYCSPSGNGPTPIGLSIFPATVTFRNLISISQQLVIVIKAKDAFGNIIDTKQVTVNINPLVVTTTTANRAGITSFTYNNVQRDSAGNLPILRVNSGGTATISGILSGPVRLTTIGCTFNQGDAITIKNLSDNGTYCGPPLSDGRSGNGPWLNPAASSYTLQFTNSTNVQKELVITLRVYDDVSGINIATSQPANSQVINVSVGPGAGAAGGTAGTGGAGTGTGTGTGTANRASITAFTISGSSLVNNIPTLNINSGGTATISGTPSGPVRVATLGCSYNQNNDVIVYSPGDGGTYCGPPLSDGRSGNGPWLNPSSNSYTLQFTNRSTVSRELVIYLRVYDDVSGTNVYINPPAETKVINVTVGPGAGATGDTTGTGGTGGTGTGTANRASITAFTISGSSLVNNIPTLNINSGGTATLTGSIAGPVRIATLGCAANPNNDVTVYNSTDGGTYCGPLGNGPWLNPSASSYQLRFTNRSTEARTIVLSLRVHDDVSGTNLNTSFPADAKVINITVQPTGATAVTPQAQYNVPNISNFYLNPLGSSFPVSESGTVTFTSVKGGSTLIFNWAIPYVREGSTQGITQVKWSYDCGGATVQGFNCGNQYNMTRSTPVSLVLGDVSENTALVLNVWVAGPDNVFSNIRLVAITVTPRARADLFSLTSREMRFGDRGDDVTRLQICLNSIPGLLTPSISQFGYFGTRTNGAVIKLQQQNQGEIYTSGGRENGTGIAGFYTKVKLNKLCASQAGFVSDDGSFNTGSGDGGNQ